MEKAALAAGAAAVGLTPESVSAQTYEAIFQFDWNSVQFFPPYIPFHEPYIRRQGSRVFRLNPLNPNIKFFDDGHIKEFYGIREEDFLKLHGHPHSGDRDPYAGHTNKVGDSCCNRYDCGPAEVREVGKTAKGEIIYAYGIISYGSPAFALSIPTITEIYDKDNRMGDHPNHGCILHGIPMCLFLDKIS